jgi:hypothetical protein
MGHDRTVAAIREAHRAAAREWAQTLTASIIQSVQTFAERHTADLEHVNADEYARWALTALARSLEAKRPKARGGQR